MRIHVEGIPAPQGSKNSAIVNGKIVMWEASATKVAAWRKAIRQACQDWMNAGGKPFGTEALVIEITFILERPKSNTRQYPTTKPDLDKLIRATLDGLTQAAIWRDDCQIVAINAIKVYESKQQPPGAFIDIKVF